MKKTLNTFLFILIALNAFGQLKFAEVFQDNMVLQANKEIQIWGEGKPSSEFKISLDKKAVNVKVNKDGKWSVSFPKMKYGGPYELKAEGNETITYKNVMVGEVWFCAGQSNMRWFVRDANNPREEIKNSSNYSNIRFLAMPLSGSDTPKTEVKAKWEVCSSTTIKNKTAVGYFFGKELSDNLKGVAIGLIDISYGGASISTFMDAETIKNSPEIEGIERRNKNFLAHYHKQKKKWDENPEGKAPYFPENCLGSYCFNDMIHPLIPYTVQGMIWYQGETNAGEPKPYITWYGEFVGMMRKHFKNENMPTYFVQLAGFKGVKGREMQNESWAMFRLAQAECLKFENTGMATAMDVGEAHDIHPRNKQEVGRRLSLLALRDTYKKKVIAEGPTVKSYKVDNNKLIITFDNVAKQLTTSDGKDEVIGFAVRNDEGKLDAISAKIIGKNKVEVNLQGNNLIMYAYAKFPECNLYNSANLPATPFNLNIDQMLN
ncbi:sialate O-acetylesterase [Flammeovirga sp. MY04]|uniref:sialate O-acetylesterase n=1 Tax=Flammeovirga sp. MY04 TaxID=1191459 RepID=UPI000806142A|nr:sialate O-acetylesterase [Flammeovirga sp. MY04]ANQ52478.1 sialate O-acetylesterase [Flammeovirga sp. MY04]